MIRRTPNQRASAPRQRSTLPAGFRVVNRYYSNLIAGHNTHPVDIERAIREDFSEEPEKRDLQLEPRAHVTAQQWIDDDGLVEKAMTQAGVCEVLPERLIWVEDPDSAHRIRLEPGIGARSRSLSSSIRIAQLLGQSWDSWIQS